MKLLLICNTAIIEHIFNLVCKRLGIDLNIEKNTKKEDPPVPLFKLFKQTLQSPIYISPRIIFSNGNREQRICIDIKEIRILQNVIQR